MPVRIIVLLAVWIYSVENFGQKLKQDSANYFLTLSYTGDKTEGELFERETYWHKYYKAFLNSFPAKERFKFLFHSNTNVRLSVLYSFRDSLNELYFPALLILLESKDSVNSDYIFGRNRQITVPMDLLIYDHFFTVPEKARRFYFRNFSTAEKKLLRNKGRNIRKHYKYKRLRRKFLSQY